MNRVLIDTDVVLDFFFDRAPFSDYAEQLFGLCERKQIEGYLTPVIYCNVYYLLRRNASHKKVIEHLKQLMTITHVLSMDKKVVENALYSDFKDFEDGLQYFTAVKNGKIDIIISRNLKDYAKSEIGVMTAEAYLKSRVVGRD